MAPVDLEKSPDYDALIETLLEKTKAGKLDWQTTANEDTYIAAVKGQRTFEVGKEGHYRASRTTVVGEGRPITTHSTCSVKVRGPDGTLLIETPSSKLADELFQVVRRLALRVDENIDSTVQLLEAL